MIEIVSEDEVGAVNGVRGYEGEGYAVGIGGVEGVREVGTGGGGG